MAVFCGLIIIIINVHFFHTFSLVLYLLNEWCTLPLRLQFSECFTFLVTCDVSSTADICTETTQYFPGIVSRHFHSLLIRNPVAPMITGVIKHWIFHIRWIFILKCLYFNLFSDSFCITFLSGDIATSISKQRLAFLFLLIVFGLSFYHLIPQYCYILTYTLEYQLRYVGLPVVCCFNA